MSRRLVLLVEDAEPGSFEADELVRFTVASQELVHSVVEAIYAKIVAVRLSCVERYADTVGPLLFERSFAALGPS